MAERFIFDRYFMAHKKFTAETQMYGTKFSLSRETINFSPKIICSSLPLHINCKLLIPEIVKTDYL